jgi:dCMP deaminase
MMEIYGEEVYKPERVKFFFREAEHTSTLSTCLSRQVGAVLVRDKVIVATGYNGPPRGFPHCTECKRRKDPNYKPGMSMDNCPSVHAELNCIANAARVGVCTKGTSLFLNTDLPCKWCMSALINAGVVQVFGVGGWYDELSIQMSPLIRIHLFKREEIFP